MKKTVRSAGRDEKEVNVEEVCLKIARILLNNKCDPARVNNNGKTPLTLAVEQVSYATVIGSNSVDVNECYSPF